MKVLVLFAPIAEVPELADLPLWWLPYSLDLPQKFSLVWLPIEVCLLWFWFGVFPANFSLAGAEVRVNWVDDLYFKWIDDFAFVIALRNIDQSLGSVQFWYSAVGIFDLNLCPIWWISWVLLGATAMSKSKWFDQINYKYAPNTLPVWLVRWAAHCHLLYISLMYTYSSFNCCRSLFFKSS